MPGCATRWSRCWQRTGTRRGFSPAGRFAPPRPPATRRHPSPGFWRRERESACSRLRGFAGAGGMGEVYRARDTRLDRHVALKILSPDSTTDPRGRARFAYEARAIARLSHPHICALHDIGHHDGVDFLVMEYLRRRNAGVAAAQRSAARCRGGADRHSDRGGARAAHAEGIVHSDLKPANIMLVNGSSAPGWRAGIEAARLRARPVPADAADRRIGNASRRSRGVDRTRCDRRHSAVHGARTGARRGGGSPKRHLLVWMRALRDGLGTRGVCRRNRGRCHVRHPPCRSIGPADRSISIGRTTANASRRLEKVIERCLEKEPDRRFNADARRETRAAGRLRAPWWQRSGAARDDGLPSRSWRSSRSARRSGLACAPARHRCRRPPP